MSQRETKSQRAHRDFERLSAWLETIDTWPEFLYGVMTQMTATFTLSLKGKDTNAPSVIDWLSEIKFQSEQTTQEDEFARFELKILRFIRYTFNAKMYLACVGLLLELSHAYNLRNMAEKTIAIWKKYNTLDGLILSDKMMKQLPKSFDAKPIAFSIDGYKKGGVLMNAYMQLGRLDDGLQMLAETLKNPCVLSNNWEVRHSTHYMVAKFYNYLLRKEYSNCDDDYLACLVSLGSVMELWTRKYGNLKLCLKVKKRIKGTPRSMRDEIIDARKSCQIMAIRNFTCSRHKSYKASSMGETAVVTPLHFYYSDPLVMQFPLLNISRIYLEFPEIKKCRSRGPVSWRSLKKARKHLRRAARELDSYQGDAIQITTILVIRCSLIYAGYHYRKAEKLEKLANGRESQSASQNKSLDLDVLRSQKMEIFRSLEELIFAKDLIGNNDKILDDAPFVFQFFEFLTSYKNKLERQFVTASRQSKTANACIDQDLCRPLHPVGSGSELMSTTDPDQVCTASSHRELSTSESDCTDEIENLASQDEQQEEPSTPNPHSQTPYSTGTSGLRYTTSISRGNIDPETVLYPQESSSDCDELGNISEDIRNMKSSNDFDEHGSASSDI